MKNIEKFNKLKTFLCSDAEKEFPTVPNEVTYRFLWNIVQRSDSTTRIIRSEELFRSVEEYLNEVICMTPFKDDLDNPEFINELSKLMVDRLTERDSIVLLSMIMTQPLI